MKLSHKKPCKECPFRKCSPRGYFGPFTAEVYLEEAHGERGVLCHLAGAKKKSHACVGALQHANKSGKIYRSQELYDMQKEVGRDDENILGLKEFYEHHRVKR